MRITKTKTIMALHQSKAVKKFKSQVTSRKATRPSKILQKRLELNTGAFPSTARVPDSFYPSQD